MSADLRFLSPIDAAFLRMESPRTPMHVGGLLTFQLPADAPRQYLRELYEQMRQQPIVSAPFNQRLARGRMRRLTPAWETASEIDIDYHFRHSALPFPGGERELGVLVARLHSHPMDLRRPPWEMHLIEGLENKRFGIYFKVHHSAMDGMGALRHIRRWLSARPDSGAAPALWNLPETEAPPTSVEEPVAGLLRSSAAQLRAQFKAGAELASKLLQMSRPRDNPEGGIRSALSTPRSMFNVSVSPQRRLATQLFELSRIKALAERTHCTVNDLALGICAGAVRRYLLELNALPKTPLIASVPVGLARPDGKPGNAVAGFVVPLSTQTSDPLQRLEIVRAVTQRTKEQLHTLSSDALKQFTLLGMSPLIVGQMSGMLARLPPIFNFVLSNVVASKTPLYLQDAKLESMYPISVLFDGYALNVTVVGYDDRLAFGFTGCRNALPSLQRLAIYTADALAELEAAAGTPAPAKPTNTRSRSGSPRRRAARRVDGEDTAT